MEDKQYYIEEQINELFKNWLSLCCLWAAAIFISLSAVDYIATPENFKEFLLYRLVISLFLLMLSFLLRKFKDSTIFIHQIFGYMGILGSAITIEIMIIKFGGHRSIYYAGMILLGILMIGAIPANFSFNIKAAVLIYLIYIIPIVTTDTITHFGFFFAANAFLFFSLISILFLRYLHYKSLINEFDLRHDLLQDKTHLSSLLDKSSAELTAMLKKSSAELTGAFTNLSDQTDARKKAEEKVRVQAERQEALRTIDIIINSTHDLQSILDVLLTEILDKLKVDAANVLLLKPEQDIFEYAGHKGFRTNKIRDIKLKKRQGYAGMAVSTKEKIIIPDLSETGTLKISLGEYEFSQSFLIQEEEFKAYIGIPLLAKGQLNGVLEIFQRSVLYPEKEWLDFLDAFASQAAIAIDNMTLRENLELSKEEVLKAYDLTIEGLARAIDYRDHATKGHCQRVTSLTIEIEKMMGFNKEELVHVKRGALLHDIGKISIPDSILFKPGPLTDEEWLINRMHPVIAHEILAPVNFLSPALNIPYCHHEKWDGTGYPQGLKGEEIPLAARIFALVDILDALKSNRPYRPAMPEQKVIEHIRSLAGTHLDPKVVEVFLFLQNTPIELRSQVGDDSEKEPADELRQILDNDPYFYFDE